MSLPKLLRAFEAMKNFVAGENGKYGNAIIQRLTVEYGSLEKR
jgi:hypothetical protein